MQTTLVVVLPFGPHKIGDLITAADTAAQILASDQARCVVQTTIPGAAPVAAAAISAKTEG